jgi:hypothetical protein
MSRARLTVELWWVDIPGEPRAFFDSSPAAWTHAGGSAERLLPAQVYRGTFVVRPDTVEHVGDFTSMAESFRKHHALMASQLPKPT